MGKAGARQGCSELLGAFDSSSALPQSRTLREFAGAGMGAGAAPVAKASEWRSPIAARGPLRWPAAKSGLWHGPELN